MRRDANATDGHHCDTVPPASYWVGLSKPLPQRRFITRGLRRQIPFAPTASACRGSPTTPVSVSACVPAAISCTRAVVHIAGITGRGQIHSHLFRVQATIPRFPIPRRAGQARTTACHPAAAIASTVSPQTSHGVGNPDRQRGNFLLQSRLRQRQRPTVAAMRRQHDQALTPQATMRRAQSTITAARVSASRLSRPAKPLCSSEQPMGMDRRNQHRQPFRQPLSQRHRPPGIGTQRQMWAVLLGRAQRQNHRRHAGGDGLRHRRPVNSARGFMPLSPRNHAGAETR
jgi:hypothetical protein